MIKASYRAFVQVNYLCIELMRQFYAEERWFRVIGAQGKMEFVQFTGRQIAQKPQGTDYGLDLGYRVPIFDIEVTAQKASPFSTVAQNERAKELYGMGFFRPDLSDQALAALDMMSFDGIEQVRQNIAKNGTMYQQIQQLQQLVAAMSMRLDATQGTQYGEQVAQIIGQQQQQTPQGNPTSEKTVNALGDALNAARNSTAGAARQRAAELSTPRT